MKPIVFRCGLGAGRWPALLTLVCVGIASLGPVLRTEARSAVVGGTGVPRNIATATVTVGQNPDCLAISPDSNTVYAANSGSFPGTVSVIYVANSPVVEATITTPNFVNFLALDLDGTTLYVSEEAQGPGPGLVEVYDVTIPASPTLKATLTAGYYPRCMALSPDNTELYVANGEGVFGRIDQGQNPGAVYVFDTATNTLKNIIVTNGSPFQVLFTNNGQQVDVLNQTGAGFIQFIDTATGIVSSSIGAGGRIFGPAGMVGSNPGVFSPSETLYVADAENYVTVCDANDGAATKTIRAVKSVFDAEPLGQPALTANGEYLYVPYGRGGFAANAEVDPIMRLSNNQVAMIDVSSGKIVGPLITVGYGPVWAQASPDGNTLYVCNSVDGTVSVIDIEPN